MKHYDYIFAGAGLSSLMTVYKMIQSKRFSEKSILLIDQNPKKTNDRTWCFWEKPNHDWENIVSKKWDTAFFANEKFVKIIDLKPYQYNMIQGIDFYEMVFNSIYDTDNCTFLNESIIKIVEIDDQAIVETSNEKFSCNKLFNSIYDKNAVESQTRFPILQQHFIGWFIESEEAVFDENTATFMDFSLNQNCNTKFMYVLPFSKNRALLEPTLFSHHHLKKEEYELEIKKYADKIGIKNYKILEKEYGSIPMTCYQFWQNNTKNILNIGTAGGWTKASTGFTFYNSNKKSNELLAFLETETDFRKFAKKTKFWYYDLIFLEVLDKNNELGSAIFSSLFKSGKPKLIFKFLNEETNWLEDIKVMVKCPQIPFIKAVLRLLYKSKFQESKNLSIFAKKID
jgi:lycopene beta-cyclase